MLRIVGVIASVCVCLSPPAAKAEMGSSPVASGNTYVSLYGGYFYSDIFDVRGIDTANSFGQADVTDVDVEHNGFGGVELGYALPHGAGWLGVDRIEVFFEAGHGSWDDDGVDNGARLRNVTGDLSSTVVSAGGVPHHTERERRYYGGGLRFRADSPVVGNHPLPIFIEPFLRLAHDDTFMSFNDAFSIREREGNIDAVFAGLLAGVDPEIQVSETLALVGSFSGGVYYFHGEGDFNSFANNAAAFNASFDDTKDGVGFRGRATLALRHMLSPGMAISLFGGIDFWSDVPYAALPVNGGGAAPASVRSSDELDVRAGIRVTISLAQPN